LTAPPKHARPCLVSSCVQPKEPRVRDSRKVASFGITSHAAIPSVILSGASSALLSERSRRTGMPPSAASRHCPCGRSFSISCACGSQPSCSVAAHRMNEPASPTLSLVPRRGEAVHRGAVGLRRRHPGTRRSQNHAAVSPHPPRRRTLRLQSLTKGSPRRHRDLACHPERRREAP